MDIPGKMRDLGEAMIRINTCLLDAKLTQELGDAILNVARVEDDQALCPMQANERFAAAQAAWIEHKVICRFCCGQELSRVH
jgi:hypothetical protein